jgi:hypothetical protein
VRPASTDLQEEAVANVTNESVETQAILQRMADVRYDLDEDVQGIVEGARDMGQWRSYVRAYPWWCLGGALALGYLVVPRRAPGTPPIAQDPAQFVGRSHTAAPISPLVAQASGMLWAVVGNLAMRAASNYALQLADKLVASPAAKAGQNVRHE